MARVVGGHGRNGDRVRRSALVAMARVVGGGDLRSRRNSLKLRADLRADPVAVARNSRHGGGRSLGRRVVLAGSLPIVATVDGCRSGSNRRFGDAGGGGDFVAIVVVGTAVVVVGTAVGVAAAIASRSRRRHDSSGDKLRETHLVYLFTSKTSF
ncbi:hypothetical protein FN846DRAFT_958015 [Sphaerosporella brunnea]|uniref:Uncharacterized protein n=1 Tax=Sphaerosporella brunnea TaxID=1250544 RepID=A0A5J5EQT9_9PEZI|nr:hypothetical protein FN846DRAFT_958015 [Sphaerosporella brunnea]